MTPDEQIAALRKENDVLRGLLPALKAPCPYCGLTNMAQCTRGFPGCGLADDLLCGEETAAQSLLDRLHALEGQTRRQVPSTESVAYVVDGVSVSISNTAKLRIRLIDRISMECYAKGDYDARGRRYGLRIYVERVPVVIVPPTFLTQAQAREWGDKLVNVVRQ